MSIFYFHTESESRFTDTEGTELLGMTQARAEAARLAARMLAESAPKFWTTKPWTITVTDKSGLIFFAIEVSGYSAPASRPPETPV
jgi:hypothetical protein